MPRIHLKGRESVVYSAYGIPQAIDSSDTDANGSVDLQDQGVVLAGFGDSVGDANYHAGADADANGTIDLVDLNAVLNFTTTRRGQLSTLGSTIGFGGAPYDQLFELSLMRNRWYSPWLGRWLTRDPAGYVDGMSQYLYVKGNPLVYFDPFGMFGVTDVWRAAEGMVGSVRNAVKAFGEQRTAEAYNYPAGSEIERLGNATAAAVPFVVADKLFGVAEAGLRLGGDGAAINEGVIDGPMQERMDGMMGTMLYLDETFEDGAVEGTKQLVSDVADSYAEPWREGDLDAIGDQFFGLGLAAMPGGAALRMARGVGLPSGSYRLGARASRHPDELKGAARQAAAGNAEAPRTIGPAHRQTGETVIGHRPAYSQLSEERGARRFEIPDDVWESMTPEERWAANEKFLQRTLERGDRILLATHPDDAYPNSFYAREIEWLEDKGYTVDSSGTCLIPPAR